jgi:hypothetical protein
LPVPRPASFSKGRRWVATNGRPDRSEAPMADQPSPDPDTSDGDREEPVEEEQPVRMPDPAGMGDIPPDLAEDPDAEIPFREEDGPSKPD